MSAFILADVEVLDLEAYKASGYLENTPRIAASFGGKYRIRGGDMQILESDWKPARVVLIEFPDMQSLQAFYTSEEYEPWIKVRQSCTRSKIVAIQGVVADPVVLE